MKVDWFYSLLIMAGVTYGIRMIPLVFWRRTIRSIRFQSFLHYLPYGVLSAMTLPGILQAPGSAPAGWSALLIGLILAFLERSLLFVAMGTVLAAFLIQSLLG